jgi:hypothetical protein
MRAKLASTHPCGSCKDPGRIFVFGSNLAGAHGAGAALHALDYHKARLGQGTGYQGYSYGIPTKDENIRTLPLKRIVPGIREFLRFAAYHQELRFFLTRIGCGLAGYTDEQMAPLFTGVTDNVQVPDEWQELILVAK